MIHACTCIAVNYLPKARVMCESLKRYHPEFKVHLVLVDQVPTWFDVKHEPFDNLITIEELGIPSLKSWIFRYNVLEVCTGVKPFALRYIMDSPDDEGVFFFDPDIVFFSRLDDLVQELKQNSILLMPHQTQPERTHEAIFDNEICSLKYGIFNLGFLGVKNDDQAKAFLDWWADRLDRYCYADLDKGLWVDQKWINLVPSFFEGVKIIKNSRFDVAPWNLTTRNLQGSFEEGFTVDGQPLAFYHFTGFDSGAHEIMATKYGGHNKAVRSMIKWYKSQIRRDKLAKSTPWAYGEYKMFENGEPITEAHRIIYRIRMDLQETYPDPFKVVENGQCYYNWFRWQAKMEHPEVIEGVTSGKEGSVIKWRRVFRHLRRAISDYRYGLHLWRVTQTVIRNEGLKGLKHYLSR